VALRAVTFDFWNTLIRADDGGFRERRTARWLELLASEGIEVDADQVVAAMFHAGGRFDANWKANRFYGAADSIDDMLDHLGAQVSPATRQHLLEVITDPPHVPTPAPNVADALEALRSAGIRIGIICDVGLAPSPTLRRFLERNALLDHFDHWSFSDEVGTFKPDPAIFAHAHAGLGGLEPAETAHVGDLRRTDIAGAQGVGALAVRYSGIFDDPGSADDGTDQVEGDAVIADHADLLGALGLS
jgi:FMN phosphatase YigB (HAD superfamily)